MKRPYRTEYSTDAKHAACTYGHSCSEQGAVRGAVVRVFMQQYSLARIHRDGVLLFSVRRTPESVQVRYGRS